MNTLEDWLVRNVNNTHSQVYLQWNVRRPAEKARKVIKGILGSLADMHNSGRYHGVLYNPTNNILKRVQNHDISRDWRYSWNFVKPQMLSTRKQLLRGSNLTLSVH